MKTGLVGGTVLLGVSLLAVAAPNENQSKVSYGLGVDIATNLKRLGIELDLDRFVHGFRDAYTGKKLEIADKELNELMAKHQSELRDRQQKAQKDLSDANLKAGEEFLEKNGKKPDVVKLPGGVQYRVIKMGAGPKPGVTDTVEAQYEGRLVNGKHGGPVTFTVQGVIPGWQQVLQLMPVGSKWEVAIPSQYAYGPRGSGRDIGPNETLVFDIELLGIKTVSKPEEPKSN
jgi:FKBP-type peptidyl-prolyl cis-trans isomerase